MCLDQEHVGRNCVGMQTQPVKPRFPQCSRFPKEVLAGALSVTGTFVSLRTLCVARGGNPARVGRSTRGNLSSLVAEGCWRVLAFGEVGARPFPRSGVSNVSSFAFLSSFSLDVSVLQLTALCRQSGGGQ